MVQVFIVEDHPIIRQGYALILQRDTDIHICGEADSGEAALLQIPLLAADVVLVDFSLPGMNGLEFVQHLRKDHPTLVTIVISGHKDETFTSEILAAGATHYIVKEQAPYALIPTIRQIMAV